MKPAIAVLFAALLAFPHCEPKDECNARFFENVCVGPTTWGVCIPGEGEASYEFPNRWHEEECPAGAFCVVPDPFDAGAYRPGAEALCSYSQTPIPECEGRERYCDSPTSETECKFGYPIQRRPCGTCRSSSGNSTCHGHRGDSCSASQPCAPGFACIHFDGQTARCLGERGADCWSDEDCAPGLSCTGLGATIRQHTCQ